MKNQSGFATVWAVLLTAVISLAVGAGGYYFYQQQADSTELSIQPTESSSETSYKKAEWLGVTQHDGTRKPDVPFTFEVPRDWNLLFETEYDVAGQPSYFVEAGPKPITHIGRGGRVSVLFIFYTDKPAKQKWDEACKVQEEGVSSACLKITLDGQQAYVQEVTLTEDGAEGNIKGAVYHNLYFDHPTVLNKHYRWDFWKKFPATASYQGMDYSDELNHLLDTFKFDRVKDSFF